MTDRDVVRVLAQGRLAAVLMNRGGWLSANTCMMSEAFAADDKGPAVWRIDLHTKAAEEPWHSVFTLAEHVVGLSIVRERNSYADLE